VYFTSRHVCQKKRPTAVSKTYRDANAGIENECNKVKTSTDVLKIHHAVSQRICVDVWQKHNKI